MKSTGTQLLITNDILSLFKTDQFGNLTYNGLNLLDTDTLAIINGQLAVANKTRRAISDAAGTLAATDYLIAYTALTATRAFTLGAASAFAGQHFVLKDESGQVGSNVNPITIVGVVDGATNPSAIAANYGKYRFYSNGTAWFTE